MAEIQCINKCGNLSNEGSDYCEDCEYGIGNGDTMTKKEFNDLFKLPRIEESKWLLKDSMLNFANLEKMQMNMMTKHGLRKLIK